MPLNTMVPTDAPAAAVPPPTIVEADISRNSLDSALTVTEPAVTVPPALAVVVSCSTITDTVAPTPAVPPPEIPITLA